MNASLEIKLMAYLDGELSAGEAAEMEALLKTNAEAKALANELGMVRTAMHGNEMERSLPESQDFYWSKIERAIALEAKASRPTGLGWLLRYWPQLSGATVAAGLLLFCAMQFNWVNHSNWQDIESASDTGALCFRSESDRISLVWVYDHDTAPKTEATDTVN